METNEISSQEVTVYNHLCENPDKWLTAKDIATNTGSNLRTVQKHLLRFVQLGLIDLAEVFPQHRYRWSSKADKRNKAYMQRLEMAREIFLSL